MAPQTLQGDFYGVPRGEIVAVTVHNSGNITCLSTDTKPAALDGAFLYESDSTKHFERRQGVWVETPEFRQADHDALANPHHVSFTQTNHDALANPHHSNANDHAQSHTHASHTGIGATDHHSNATDHANTEAVHSWHTAHHTRLHTVVDTLDHTFPGGTANFRRADGTWNAPGGGGGGNATVMHLVAYAALSKTMTNIGTAYKDIYVGLTDLGNDKQPIDFGGATSFRIVHFWDYIGAGAQQVRWVDQANNANVLWESATFTADQDPGNSGWLALPAWATGDKTIEWQGKSNTAADDPVAKGFRIFLK